MHNTLKTEALDDLYAALVSDLAANVPFQLEAFHESTDQQQSDVFRLIKSKPFYAAGAVEVIATEYARAKIEEMRESPTRNALLENTLDEINTSLRETWQL